MLVQGILRLLGVKGRHRDAKTRGIKVMSFAMLLVLVRPSLAGVERREWTSRWPVMAGKGWVQRLAGEVEGAALCG